ncbi:MAG: GntR family transcriptional regulator [Kiritimatiellae bacterium]|nr:GntR family transcriptional regulator [Kiritimatiellia bacterium]
MKLESIPKHVRIRQAILNFIAQNALETGDRVPSEQALAAEFAVSVITTRRAMDDLAQSGVLARVRGKGTFIKRTDFSAHPLGRIAFLLIDRPPEAERYAVLIERAATEIRRRNHGVDVIATGPSPDSSTTEELAGAAGVLLTGAVTSEWARFLRDMSLPFVVLGAYDLDVPVWSVQEDRRKGTELLLRRFLDLRCRRIGLIATERSYRPCAEVWAAFRAWIPRLDLEADEDWVVSIESERRVEAVRDLFSRGGEAPDALLTFGGCFLAALSVLYELGGPFPVLGAIQGRRMLKRALPRVFEVGFDGPLEQEGVRLLFDVMADGLKTPETIYTEPTFTPPVE